MSGMSCSRTFTPLKGLSDVVQLYMPGGRVPPEQVPISIAA
jgi:phage terminase large subunit-like protein